MYISNDEVNIVHIKYNITYRDITKCVRVYGGAGAVN
jgi:hypothetical protein